MKAGNEMGEQNFQEGLRAVLKTLRDFGYDELTYAEVEDAFLAWQRGDTSRSSIIHMMAGKQFDDYPEVFGLPAIRNQEE